jgi:enoyl-CoA hydratase
MTIEYRIDDGVARITLDDGKVNALGSEALIEIGTRLDEAHGDGASALILSGRDGMLSAGFDLSEVRSGDEARERLRGLLVDLVIRLFEFECPVIVACPGHAMAAGAALLLAADRRVGVEGPYKVGFNEAALGVTISGATVELARYRMPMPWFESLVSGDTFAPRDAVAAGLLDRVVDEPGVMDGVAGDVAEELRRVPTPIFVEMRHLARKAVTARLRDERAKLGSPA